MTATGMYSAKQSGVEKREKGVWELAEKTHLVSRVDLPFYALLKYYDAFPGGWEPGATRPPNTWRRPPDGLPGTTVVPRGGQRPQRNSLNERGVRLAPQHREE